MKNKVAVLSAIYPAVVSYLPALLESLSIQTYTSFDWVVINDGVDSNSIKQQVSDRFPCTILEFTDLKPAKNRLEGIKHCFQHGYDYIIFQDADDWMSNNRIADSLYHLDQEPIVFNAIDLVDEKDTVLVEDIWQTRLSHRQVISQSFINNKNCIGLGNAAIRTNIIPETLFIPDEIIAVDWFLFYTLLKNNNAVYSSNSKVFYRQHEANIAGFPELNRESIDKAVKVKRTHYQFLSPLFPELQEVKNRFGKFEREVASNEDILNQYIIKNKNKHCASFWWEATNYTL